MLNYKLSENEAMRLFFCCDETNQSKIEYWRASRTICYISTISQYFVMLFPPPITKSP